eukprot:324725-Pyramimonas_sp.AAC.1
MLRRRRSSTDPDLGPPSTRGASPRTSLRYSGPARRPPPPAPAVLAVADDVAVKVLDDLRQLVHGLGAPEGEP